MIVVSKSFLGCTPLQLRRVPILTNQDLMPDKRKWGEDHINKSIKQIDTDSWLVGHMLLRRYPYQSDIALWNDDQDGSSYSLTEAPVPYHSTSKIDSPYFKLVHEAGDASAVWSIGNVALCKVRYIEDGVTPESVTLDFVQKQNPSFEIPKVFSHVFDDDISFLFLQRVPGRTLDVAWPSLTEDWKRHYVQAIVKVCKEMSEWKANKIGGVDSQNIPEYFLVTPGVSDDFSSIGTSCKAIGMDCSTSVFYHADLGPTNIVVEEEPSLGKVGVIDFEISGYFPIGWVRTKFRLSSGMNLSVPGVDPPTRWRSDVQKALGDNGFVDHVEAWKEWQYGKSN